jgi:hypothetical protein
MADEIEIVSSPRPEREDWHAGVAAGLGEVHGDRFLRREFVECDVCRAKPGMPMLCYGCLANRTTVGALERENQALCSALAEALDGWAQTLDDYCETQLTRNPKERRIAELRAKFLGGASESGGRHRAPRGLRAVRRVPLLAGSATRGTG